MSFPRKKLLLVCPAVPSLTGGGTPIRAAMLLQAAAADHEVFVVVAPLARAGSVEPGDLLAPPLRTAAAAVALVPLLATEDPDIETILELRDRALSRDAAMTLFEARLKARRAGSLDARNPGIPFVADLATRAIARHPIPFADTAFDVVLVMSIRLLPFGLAFLESATSARCVLDVDDVESTKHRRFAELHLVNNAPALADVSAREAALFGAFEREHLPRFDAVLACSSVDRNELARRVGLADVRVVPNGVPQPDTDDRSEVEPPTDLIFVGALGYFPNADAILFFCRDVLPEIRARVGRPVTLRIVSRDIPGQLAPLRSLPGVTIRSDVEALAPHYRSARVAIAPIRAGGGTRIKILEAFGHRTPVVSTTIGAEGLDVADGIHLLIADGQRELADGCCRLLSDPALGSALADQAFHLVQRRYTFSVVCPILRRILLELSDRGLPAP